MYECAGKAGLCVRVVGPNVGCTRCPHPELVTTSHREEDLGARACPIVTRSRIETGQKALVVVHEVCVLKIIGA